MTAHETVANKELLEAAKHQNALTKLQEESFLKIPPQDRAIIAMMYWRNWTEVNDLNMNNFSIAKHRGFRRTFQNFLRDFPQMTLFHKRLKKPMSESIVQMAEKSRVYSPQTLNIVERTFTA